VQQRAPRKKKGKEKVGLLAEPVRVLDSRLSANQFGPLGHALPEAVGRIVNFYTSARVTQSGGGHLSAKQKKVLVDWGLV